MYLIVRYRPVGIIGFGGYPSFPVMKAAQLLRVPNMIHDQNGILGKANQYLAKKTKIIATSLPNTAGIRAEDQKKVVFTGNPVRPSILHARFTDYQQPENDKPFRLFVVGGSQGAKIFSKVVPKALARLPVQLRRRLVVTQQCRPDDCLETKNFYQENKIEAVIQPFFKDIADILIKSHLVISRSGASSVSEIATIGRPAIFIPFSHADEQQIINANVLVERQAAWMIVESGFNEEILSSQLETLMQLPDKLKEAADKAKSCAKPTAAKDLADVVQRLIEE